MQSCLEFVKMRCELKSIKGDKVRDFKMLEVIIYDEEVFVIKIYVFKNRKGRRKRLGFINNR